MTYDDENVKLVAIPHPWEFIPTYPADGTRVAELRINPESHMGTHDIAAELRNIAHIVESGTQTYKSRC